MVLALQRLSDIVKSLQYFRYTHDGGWIAPTPGIVRGVKEAVRLLKLRGHEVVHFKPPQLEKGYR